MTSPGIAVVDFTDARAGGERRARFVDGVGAALAHIGFFAVRNHGIPSSTIEAAYREARAFFALTDDVKRRYEDAARKAQRGYTSFGKEHAKGVDAPDLKEFWQVGRTDVPDDHAIHAPYGPNVWPRERPAFRQAMTALYESLDALGRELLVACAEYVGEPAGRYADMAREGDTILRVIHYPPVDDEPLPAVRSSDAGGIADGALSESIRAGAHEDINLITLLVGATEDGLELLQKDGSWLPIRAQHDEILVDTGDMMQWCTNGLYRSTTHRVVRPKSEKRGEPRYSMPCFIHPRPDVVLAPSSSTIAKTGGVRRYDPITAGDYLTRRLKEIGVG